MPSLEFSCPISEDALPSYRFVADQFIYINESIVAYKCNDSYTIAFRCHDNLWQIEEGFLYQNVIILDENVCRHCDEMFDASYERFDEFFDICVDCNGSDETLEYEPQPESKDSCIEMRVGKDYRLEAMCDELDRFLTHAEERMKHINGVSSNETDSC